LRDRVMSAGLSPDPFSVTACACSASEMVKVPLSGPSAVGAKVTEMLHVEPAARVLPQLLTAAKSPLGVLTIEVPIPVSGRPPVFEIVTVSGAEICVSTVEGKLRLVAESVSVGPVTAVPLSDVVCVPMLSVTVNVPVAAPAAVGAKATVIAHAVLAARELPQVLALLVNGAVTAIEVTDTAVPPELARLTFCPGLVVPVC
jgi:hypothetical protein